MSQTKSYAREYQGDRTKPIHLKSKLFKKFWNYKDKPVYLPKPYQRPRLNVKIFLQVPGYPNMASFVNSLRGITYSAIKSTLHKETFNNYVNPSLLSVLQTNAQLIFVRTKVVRRIRGLPRPRPPGEIPPEPMKYKFKVHFPADGKYTTKPLKITKLGGRHPETGKLHQSTKPL